MQAEIRQNLSKDEINEYPLYKYKGKIVLVQTEEEMEAPLARIRQEKILGFDTETKPSFRKGKAYTPAILQLACSDVVFLFLLRKLSLGSALSSVLADPAIIKTGVAVRDDMRFLGELYPFEPAAISDLSDIARRNGLKVYGLRGLAARLLNVRISKSARCSNWNNAELTSQQVSYAATDAWISRELYLRMREMGMALNG